MALKLSLVAALFAATAAQAVPVQLRSGAGTGVSGKLLATYNTFVACAATSAKYPKPSHCYDVPAPSPAPTPCPAQPPAESRTNTCPAGTVGDWTQQRDYAAAPAPTCWVANVWTPAAPISPPDCPAMAPTPNPGGFDAVTGLPIVDMSKVPVVNPTQQYSANRSKLVPQPPTGNFLAAQNLATIGAFRESCFYAGMNKDDALVFPGQPGVSHLHAYFGVIADAFTTSSGILNATTSTCAGGLLNRAAYWMPAMIDTLDGAPQKPTGNNVYYKGSYLFPTFNQIVPVPSGLHLITGDSTNTDPAKGRGRFICIGPNGENPGWKNTISAAFADGTCVGTGRSEFIAEIDFPICWDGVNLDSPDHKAHVVGAHQTKVTVGGVDTYPWSCPVDHPAVLPTISYNIHYAIPNAQAVGRWYLSSDRFPAPPGSSAHADYFFGWDTATRDNFTAHCLNEQRDCHNYLLGDNINMLY